MTGKVDGAFTPRKDEGSSLVVDQTMSPNDFAARVMGFMLGAIDGICVAVF